jgi:hypothetical protein
VVRKTNSAIARQLKDLAGVGPATMRYFDELGVRNVDELAMQDPQELYARLSRLKGVRIDPCCLDGFTCAVAQARDPNLSDEKCKWWYWSRVRKSGRSHREGRRAT